MELRGFSTLNQNSLELYSTTSEVSLYITKEVPATKRWYFHRWKQRLIGIYQTWKGAHKTISLRTWVGNRNQQVWGSSHPKASCISLIWYGLLGATCLKQKQCLAYQRYSNIYDTKKGTGEKDPCICQHGYSQKLGTLNQISSFLYPIPPVGRSASSPYFYTDI